MNTFTQEPSYEVDQNDELINNCIEQISRRFKSANDVTDAAQCVQDLMRYTGYSCWEDYCAENDTSDWFKVTPINSDTTAPDKHRVAQFEKLLARVTQLFEAADATTKSVEAQIAELKKKSGELEQIMTVTQFGFNTDDKGKNEAATRAKAAVDAQIPLLQKNLRSARLERAKLIAQRDIAKARLEVVIKHAPAALFRTGNTILDMELYAKIASHAIWKVASIQSSILEIKLKMDSERAETVANGYENLTERLHKLELAQNSLMELFASCELQFETDAATLGDEPNGWMPVFPSNFHKELLAAQAKIALAATRRAQERQAATIRAREEGYY